MSFLNRLKELHKFMDNDSNKLLYGYYHGVYNYQLKSAVPLPMIIATSIVVYWSNISKMKSIKINKRYETWVTEGYINIHFN